MNLHNLSKITKNRRRVGRGIAAGRGKTAGRGTKGQKSRSGYNIPRFFEGGQTKLFARLPKVKGPAIKRTNNTTIAITVDAINKKYASGGKVTISSLVNLGLISKNYKYNTVKIIGGGKIKPGIDISECKNSKSVKNSPDKS